MLETIIVLLLALWLFGVVTGQTFGSTLHVLFVLALIVFVIRVLNGRRAA